MEKRLTKEEFQTLKSLMERVERIGWEIGESLINFPYEKINYEHGDFEMYFEEDIRCSCGMCYPDNYYLQLTEEVLTDETYLDRKIKEREEKQRELEEEKRNKEIAKQKKLEEKERKELERLRKKYQ